MTRSTSTVVELADFTARRDRDAADGDPGAPPPAGKVPSSPGKSKGRGKGRGSLMLRMRAWEDGTRFFPLVTALGAIVFGLAIPHAPETAMLAALAVGALVVLNRRLKLGLVTLVLGINLLVSGQAQQAPESWTLVGLAMAGLFMPQRLLTPSLQPPRWAWVVVLALVIVCRAAALQQSGLTPIGLSGAAITIIGMPLAAYLGAGLARHLAVGDARLLSWGDDGLVPVTRDLLLGRVTSGMLHDLAQPLNVISMANGNMGYIIDQLDIDAQTKANLADRIARISTHTEAAAQILALFRGFGRDSQGEPGHLAVRDVLARAIAATRSNVRHHGVVLDIGGDALDHPVPAHHGALEMMAVAALLNAFAAYIRADGSKRKGTVRVAASLGPAFVSITVQCSDEHGLPLTGPMLDPATHWLVEQVAAAASGDFRVQHRDGKGTRFLIRLGRDDI